MIGQGAPVVFKRAVVALCRGCEVYMEPEAAGQVCPMTKCETTSGSTRRLVRRRGYLCEGCEEHYFFQTKGAALAHWKQEHLPYEALP